MVLFEGQNMMEFIERLKTDEIGKEYLAETKWKYDFECIKCGHKASQIRKGFSRICNRCSHADSATANTLFHKVKFGVKKAFFICFEMSTSTKSLSASSMSVRYGVAEKTAPLFMHKVREAMKSSGNNPINGEVHVDEFVVVGKEKVGRSYNSNKKKVVCAVPLTDEGEIKQFYTLKISGFPSKELSNMFEQHIKKDADIVTDLWRGYSPLTKQYNITQIPSNNGMNFKALHTIIHQVKSWIRTTYSWVSEFSINRYFDEFCFRIKRSQNKKNIFNNLIDQMGNAKKKYQIEFICS